MKSTDQFNFGKYKGLTLKEVYLGTPLELETMIDFMHYVLNEEPMSHYESIIVPSVYTCIIGFEVFEDQIVVEPMYSKPWVDDSDERITLGDICNELKLYFREIASNIKWRAMTGEKLAVENYNLARDSKICLGPDVGYINWCIENVAGFSFSRDDQEYLKSQEQNEYLGVNFECIKENVYEWSWIKNFKGQLSPSLIKGFKRIEKENVN
jgi:hypothetical protein